MFSALLLRDTKEVTMWWFLGMIFCGCLFWFVWTSRTHQISIFTLPSGAVHALLDLRQVYNCKLSIAWEDEDYRNDIVDFAILLIISTSVVMCSYFFFTGNATLFWKLVGANYLFLILASTLFLDLIHKT